MPTTEAFIAKWSQSGGSELGSSQNFLLELCDLLEVQRPTSPRADLRDNTYTFEKQVSLNGPGGKATPGRVDLYKRGAFIWESKQGSDKTASGDKAPQRKGVIPPTATVPLHDAQDLVVAHGHGQRLFRTHQHHQLLPRLPLQVYKG